MSPPGGNRILIVLTEAIGDVLLSTPAIRAVRKNNPEAFLSFLTGKRARDVLKNNSHLDEIIAVDERDTSISSFLRLLKQVRERNFLLVFQLTPYRKYHLLGWLAGIPLRVGLDHQGWTWANNRLISARPLSNLHRSDYYLAFIREMGWQTDGLVLDFTFDEEAGQEADRLLAKWGLNSTEPVIGVHPGASKKHREQRLWPPSKFRELIQVLVSRGNRVILFGGPDYHHIVEQIWQQADGRVLVLNVANLMLLSALIKRCTLMVTLDSAPLHLSTALCRPVVTLFSGIPSSLPKHWAPTYGPFRLIMRNPIADIPVKEIARNVEDLLADCRGEGNLEDCTSC